MKLIPYLLVFVSLCLNSRAQQLITVEDAVGLALKKNFDILVARENANIDKANNTPGNANMLPTLSLTGSASYENNDQKQWLSGGSRNDYPSLATSAYNAGAQLKWTLFDGGRMFVTKNKLNEIEALGELQFRDKVLQTMYDVVAAYFDVVQQKQQLVSIQVAMHYNQERVKIAQAGMNAGTLVKTDLLQARIDLNVTMEEAINQQYTILAAKKYLNQLLGQSPETDFEVLDSIPLNYVPDTANLMDELAQSNTTLLSLQKQSDIASLTLKENRRGYFPLINLNGGYFLSQSQNSAGSVLKSYSAGPQIGGTISIPLFSAGENRRKVNTARMQLQTTRYDYQQAALQTRTDLLNTLTTFQSQQKLMEIELENNKLSRENLEISLQRLRLGQTTSLEVHQAQESFVQSSTRLINFEYNLKLAETHLKQLVANL